MILLIQGSQTHSPQVTRGLQCWGCY